MMFLARVLNRHVWAAWAMLAISAAGLTFMAMHRSPPFVSLSYTATPGYRAGVAFIDAVVERDLDRGCSVTFSRAMVDAAGARWDVIPRTTATAEALREFNRASPGRLRMPIPIPPEAAIGTAKVITSLSYVCNPTHVLLPIDMVLVYKFEVMP